MRVNYLIRLLGLLLFVPFSLAVAAGEPEKMTVHQYIEHYKHLAVLEMHRTGIPASIKMAQGLLESGSGNSRLSKEGNNHFGIKCKTTWTGRTIFEDDDEDHECFRAYDSAYLSYIDHSNFLMNNQRYAFLFEYDKTDYKNWAHGLKKAGYATNPKYPILLIDIIERHELFKLDKLRPEDLDVKPIEEPVIPLVEKPELKPEKEYFAFNNIPATRANPGETVVSLAQRNDMRAWQIRKYNDFETEEELAPGEVIYLKPKKRKGSSPYHFVEEGEDMHSISQMYGIKLKHLYRKNRMDRDMCEQPAPGEKLFMQKKRSDEPKLVDTSALAKKEEMPKLVLPDPLKKEDTVVVPPKPKPDPEQENRNKPVPEEKAVVVPVITEKPKVSPEEAKDTFNIPREKTNTDTKVDVHRVQPKETLFSISRKYGVSVEQIREWNNLQDYNIQIDQELVINGNIPEKKTDVQTNDFVHLVKKGETLYSIAKLYNTTVEQLKELNKLQDNTLSLGQKLFLSKANGDPGKIEIEANEEISTHTVEKGDTLYSIARKYSLTVEKLKSLNNLADNHLIIGQTLKIK